MNNEKYEAPVAHGKDIDSSKTVAEDSALENSRKQMLWEKQISFLTDIGKEDDLPIDNENLKETIAALNVHGIQTVASNAGHAAQVRNTGDTAYPWILIEPDQGSRESGLLMHAKAQALLIEFYKGRQVEEDIKLKVPDVFDEQFSLSNIEENIARRDANQELTEEEKADLVKKLPMRQQEMYDFGKFLKSLFFRAGS